jgi:Rrf2 family transcriptional regulator, nitric oxide-sensitive transcriptional repressor
MLPQTAEYALRAVVYMVDSGDVPHTSKQIAEATKVPAGYTYKVLQKLVAAELVRSQPGPNGGYSLQCSPERVTVLDVVNAVEPVQRIRTCPLGLASHGERLCALHRELDNACAQIEASFAKVTIAEILDREGTSPPLRDACRGLRCAKAK